MSESNFWWLTAAIIGNDFIKPDERIWYLVVALVWALANTLLETWRGK